jgi:hypothetical protein
MRGAVSRPPPAREGLYHLGYREYGPSAGRFLQRDPIGCDGGFNLYGYTNDHPLGYIDPSGLDIAQFLYILKDEAGNLRKWGVTKNPKTRYSKIFLASPRADFLPVCQSTNRAQMLEQERLMIKGNAGPLNRERWAIRPKDVIYAFDPTPIGAGMAGAKILIQHVDPMVKKAQRARERAFHYWTEDEDSN